MAAAKAQGIASEELKALHPRLDEWAPTLFDLALLYGIAGFSGLGVSLGQGKPFSVALATESFIKQGSIGAGVGLFIIWKFAQIGLAACVAVLVGGGHAGKEQIIKSIKHSLGLSDDRNPPDAK